jgi:SAM-dependent MidA family methyltransferase
VAGDPGDARAARRAVTLKAILAALIRSEGPIGIDRFMRLCLQDPVHGYYRRGAPIGREGDFVTAPEISQIFGELLGLWTAQVWIDLGRPHPFRLVELGPGRGTLMADAVRAMRIVPGLLDAAAVTLVESNAALRAEQAQRLAGAPRLLWADCFEPQETPTIVLANEFLDCLPIRQFVAGDAVWHERLVGLDDAGELAFGLSPPVPLALPPASPGRIVEIGEGADDLLAAFGEAARLAPFAALLIDYGPARGVFGDTLQAVSRHRPVDPLALPGESDLTAHVRFEALAHAAVRHGLVAAGPHPQGAFLEALGLAERAERLAMGAPDAAAAAEIASGAARLTAGSPGGMGRLFHAFGLRSPGLPPLPALDDAAAPSGPDHGRAGRDQAIGDRAP